MVSIEGNDDNIFGYCQKCRQKNTHSNLFLCKGRMLCVGCWMGETRGNTIFFDESKYPRRKEFDGGD